MLYIVSGYMRTGTSMKMQGLVAGGMVAAYSKIRNLMNDHLGDDQYLPNRGGFYEMRPSEYQDPELAEKCDGKVVKLLITDTKPLNTVIKSGVPYRVVFMKRHPEEIRQSWDGFWGNTRQVMRVVNNYDAVMDKAIDRFKETAESVSVFQYRKVVEHPLSAFKVLQATGWPVDPEKAAEVVDPKQYRFKLENLEVGIV